MSVFCIQYHLECDTETNMNNCFNGIQTAIDAVTTGWENSNNKNTHSKWQDYISSKLFVDGIQRMVSETEKNILFNNIKSKLGPPQIKGNVSWHRCMHDEEKPQPCVIEEEVVG